jgi:inner membrane protein
VDPVSQGLIGAALSQSASSTRRVVTAGVLGGIAGMSADLDVLIRSETDPLLFLEYHRQFTHSLIFIPLGGLLCALALHLPLGARSGLRFAETLLFCTLGYATHGLLDACTTYGTLLLWPFSGARIAWNTISVIDPLFTLPLLVATVAAALLRRPRLALLGICWALGYLAFGWHQRNEAVAAGQALAESRGHQPLRLVAKPSFGNTLLWKIVYETPDRYFVDAVRVGLRPRIYPGESVPKLDSDRDFPWLSPTSQQSRDLARFRWFSNGYVARDPVDANRVIDIRYSIVPNEIAPLWGIDLKPRATPDTHVDYRVSRDASSELRQRFWNMLIR